MSKIEEVKALIDFLKVIIITLIVGLFSMISYLVTNLEKAGMYQIMITFFGIIIVTIILIILFKIIINKIKSLKDL